MFKEKNYLTLLAKSFPGIENTIKHCEALGFPWGNGKLFIKEEKGEVLSHIGFFRCDILIEGLWHKAGALHAICTKESHRGQGIASGLILEALTYAKSCCEFVILFTEIPTFYEKLSFRYIQEHRFHLPGKHPKGTKSLVPIISPKDDLLFLHHFKKRENLSNSFWLKDLGLIASFNTLFGTYPYYSPLYYSAAIDGFLACFLDGKTLHLLDIVTSKIPSLDMLLDHLPSEIEEIYFYFPPDQLTKDATPEPYLYENGHLMVHGNLPGTQPFMISPLSRC